MTDISKLANRAVETPAPGGWGTLTRKPLVGIAIALSLWLTPTFGGSPALVFTMPAFTIDAAASVVEIFGQWQGPGVTHPETATVKCFKRDAECWMATLTETAPKTNVLEFPERFAVKRWDAQDIVAEGTSDKCGGSIVTIDVSARHLAWTRGPSAPGSTKCAGPNRKEYTWTLEPPAYLHSP